MTHGSLFSGIGGFDLAAEWMGWENKFHCEINPFCQKVLKYHFPESVSYADIKTTDFSVWRGRIDVVTGGFPCQPFSHAGKRKGTEDDRYLWKEMLRAIREIQPRWVVGENVFGLLNWSNGMVFHEVQTDLEAAGFITFTYVLPACGVNAPHKRERVWIIAHSVNNGNLRSTGEYGCKEKEERLQERNEVSEFNEPGSLRGLFTNTNGTGWEKLNDAAKSDYQEGTCRENDVMYSDSTSKQGKHIGQKRQRELNRPDSGNGTNGWHNFPTQSPICSGNDGLSFKLDGITFPKWRNESIKGYGNAIVPEVALQIFKAIEEYEK